MSVEHVKNAGDVAAATTVLATLAGWLPSIAAILTILWTIIRIVNEWDKFAANIRKWLGYDQG